MDKVIERAKKIKILITDVDGVLTNGKLNLFINAKGELDEFKSFSAVDGLGFLILSDAGIGSAIITGRTHKTTELRATFLGFKYIYQGYLDKKDPFEDILKRENITAEEVAYIGDDIIDLPLLTKVGLAICPGNAREDVKKYCHYITDANGGDECAREVVEMILNSQGKWHPFVEDIKEARWQRKPKAKTQVFTSTGSH
ncbi:YrbI family 3-deoxy-D-manno-octulosonate 8-phosphate phosphatase [Elusimicrobium simillimum]|uniref:KdsC family phosphatase n=1 Tax=Elusimicrobium simillimum TaxID=3143438 RepID=UPI003C704AFC